MNAIAAMKHYKQVSVHGGIVDASPHRLIQMLMEGFLEKVSLAKGYMANNKVAAKGESISKAISIIDGLRGSLNMEAGGKIAENLDKLYEYMASRLMIANLRNDPSILDEVSGLMLEIKSGWDNMPESFKH